LRCFVSDDHARKAILARRAQFLAAALSSVGIGCAPSHVDVGHATVTAPRPAAAEDGDRDHDGILDVNDRCPEDPEDKDGFEDEDGCPDPDNDQDGILDADDKCPNVYAPPPSIDGCPKPQVCLSIVPVTYGVKEKIYFETSKATIRSVSMPVLDAVYAALKAYPEMLLEVRGHCDATEVQATSKQRAKAVIEYLVKKGIDKKRLTAKDLGKTEPADSSLTAEGRERNRRVDFVRTD
jgi:outer membrane protein OmpA-like peptidoglycan-associated protein